MTNDDDIKYYNYLKKLTNNNSLIKHFKIKFLFLFLF